MGSRLDPGARTLVPPAGMTATTSRPDFGEPHWTTGRPDVAHSTPDGVEARMVPRRTLTAPQSVLPQDGQNRSPAETRAPQVGHRSRSSAPAVDAPPNRRPPSLLGSSTVLP